jgi:hypothetical protein
MAGITPRVTDEQASAAIRVLTGQPPIDGEPGQGVEASVLADTPVLEAGPAETPTEAAPVSTEGEMPAETVPTDDVESLRTRLTETDKVWQAKVDAIVARNAQNDRILRDRYLRKAAVTDSALKILKGARTEYGVSEADADRVIKEMEATMNPASVSYVQPEIQAPTEPTEDQAIVLNNFLNEKGMTQTDADDFGRWVQTKAGEQMTAAEQAVAHQSLDGFLRLAHHRYLSSANGHGKPTPPPDVVGAVRSIQVTQRAAIRAGAASPVAPKKQPASPASEVDLKKLTKDDISTLLRQSTMQYR